MRSESLLTMLPSKVTSTSLPYATAMPEVTIEPLTTLTQPEGIKLSIVCSHHMGQICLFRKKKIGDSRHATVQVSLHAVGHAYLSLTNIFAWHEC